VTSTRVLAPSLERDRLFDREEHPLVFQIFRQCDGLHEFQPGVAEQSSAITRGALIRHSASADILGIVQNRCD
jgi:hypothetical protein